MAPPSRQETPGDASSRTLVTFQVPSEQKSNLKQEVQLQIEEFSNLKTCFGWIIIVTLPGMWQGIYIAGSATSLHRLTHKANLILALSRDPRDKTVADLWPWPIVATSNCSKRMNTEIVTPSQIVPHLVFNVSGFVKKIKVVSVICWRVWKVV